MSAIDKGFAIIDVVVAAGSNGLSLARIVAATAIPKSSAHRLLQDMVALSVLRRDDNTGHYVGGLKLARIGAAVMANYDLRTQARPALAALHKATGQVVTLGIRDGDVGIYVDKIEPRDTPIRLHSEIGKRFPLHCTALGKILLAHADAATRRRVLGRKLKAYTPYTMTQSAALQEALDTARENGYAVDREEITRGLVCIAAPVAGPDGEPHGAMSCTLPVHQAEEAGLDGIIAAVVHNARQASA